MAEPDLHISTAHVDTEDGVQTRNPAEAAAAAGTSEPVTDSIISLRSLFALFLRIGMVFGAGTAMSSALHDQLVRRRRAIGRNEFMVMYGLARLVPSGSMTALAVAVGYRFQGWLGTVTVLVAMILPVFVITVVLTIAYTAVSGSDAFFIVNQTLMPAALAVVIVSAWRLGREFFRPSVELVLAIGAAASVLLLGFNPTLVLVAGGLIGAVLITRVEEADGK
jgi:chromate transporter